jgi:DNA-binding LacI/PurR family transcriptional regulator
VVPLTSVSHPVDAIVEKIVELLTARLEGYDGEPRREIICGELVARESTAAPSL